MDAAPAVAAAAAAAAPPLQVVFTRHCAAALYGNSYMRGLCLDAAVRVERRLRDPRAQFVEACIV